MLSLDWDEEGAYTYTYLSEDDVEGGCESGNNSELEEIELALYNQIHYHHTSTADVMCELNSTLQEPVVWVGPGGDNSQRKLVCNEALGAIVANWEAKSKCDVKVECTSLQGSDSVHVSNLHGCMKRKRLVSDGDQREDSMWDSSEDGYIGQISSDSHESGEDDSVLMDLQLNLSQESSTCEGDFKSPQGDGQDWSLIDEDMLSQGPASIPPRYYRPDRVKPLNMRCRNCNEVGHLSKICPRPKKHLICYLCGETGHNVRSCPTSICYNCEKAAGHTARDCPSSRKRLWEVCHRCQMQGHRQFECPELWRQYHVTTKGRLNKLKLKRNPRVYCHNCGGKGHFGFECTECQVNAHSPAVYPFIARYEEYKPHATDSTKRKDHRVFGNTGPSRKKQKLDDRSAGMTTELSDHVKHGTNPLAKFQSERRRKPNQDNNVESVHYVTDYSVTDNSVKSKKAADRRKSIKQKKKNKKAANHIPTDDQERGGLIKETLNSCKNVKNRKKKSKKKNKAVSGKTCAQTVVQTKRGFNIVLPNVKVKFQD